MQIFPQKIETHLVSGRDRLLQTMFEDYCQSGEDWMRSSLLLKMSQSTKQRQRGTHKMVSVKDLKAKFGEAIATSIVKEKRSLQETKSADDPVTYFMWHPEAPDSEDSRFIWVRFENIIKTMHILQIPFLAVGLRCVVDRREPHCYLHRLSTWEGTRPILCIISGSCWSQPGLLQNIMYFDTLKIKSASSSQWSSWT